GFRGHERTRLDAQRYPEKRLRSHLHAAASNRSSHRIPSNASARLGSSAIAESYSAGRDSDLRPSSGRAPASFDARFPALPEDRPAFWVATTCTTIQKTRLPSLLRRGIVAFEFNIR